MSSVFRCQFGSRLYGTDLPTSDLDYKSVFLPTSEEILLQRVKNSRTESTKVPGVLKNQPGDIDYESFSLQKFLDLACQGQTVAIDMLFANEPHILETGPIWFEIQANRHKLLHKGSTAFIGYTKSQAAKYGIKGYRLAAVRDTLTFISGFSNNSAATLRSIEYQLRGYVIAYNSEHVAVVQGRGAQDQLEDFLEVCDRKIPLHSSIGYTIDVLQKIYDNYGERSKLANENKGLDYKALMHAVRVAHEAIELLTTHNVTFPRPEKDLLLKIRKGELPYKQIAEIIEDGLIRAEDAKSKSTLPEEPDRKWVDSFVYDVYRDIVMNPDPEIDGPLFLGW